jgi:hypothetical protein
MKIRCTTLFNTTNTGISNRRAAYTHLSDSEYDTQRNQQHNLETILQVVSLRAQPEDLSATERIKIRPSTDSRWGSDYSKIKNIPAWTFTFTVNANSVFALGDDPLGGLYSDCEGVPYVTGLGEHRELYHSVSASSQHRNIWFEIDND